MSYALEGVSPHSLFEAAADPMLLADDAGHILLANAAALQFLGYAEQELVGLSVEELMAERYRASHPGCRAVFFDHPEKLSMGQGRELTALSRDGRELPVEISLSPLKAGEQLCVLVMLYDAARRRRLEDTLHTSEERLQRAKSAAGFGIFDRDLTSNTLYLDDRSRELWGLGIEETATYEKFLAGIHPEDRAACLDALDHAFDASGNGEYHAKFRVTHCIDGIQRWIAATGHVVIEGGRAVRLVGIMQDITERRALERKFQKHRAESEQLLSQQVAVQTAAAIAHEFNQPLAAISAYSEVALHALDSDIVDLQKLRRALEGCVAQSHRAGQSLHELLDFLQQSELVSEPIDLNNVVRDALAITQIDSLGDFQPVLHLEERLPPVLANRTQVQKVLTNLVCNGIEAALATGVPVATITVITKAGNNMAQVTVQDCGPGLGAETAGRIFEPFFTTKPNGTGLGLPISRSLVEANGGRLWVGQDAGAGATFHFTLPFAP